VPLDGPGCVNDTLINALKKLTLPQLYLKCNQNFSNIRVFIFVSGACTKVTDEGTIKQIGKTRHAAS